MKKRWRVDVYYTSFKYGKTFGHSKWFLFKWMAKLYAREWKFGTIADCGYMTAEVKLVDENQR